MTDEQNQNNEYNEELVLPDGKQLVKKKRREKIIRRGRLKQERFRAFIRFLISLGLLVGFSYVLKSSGWYLDANAFNTPKGNSVEIINNKIVPSSKILAILKKSNVPKVPLYIARTSSIKKDLMQLTPIENVYIRRYAFPARVQIIIRERTPMITISPDEKASPVAFFTTDGKLIGRDFLPLDKSYKTLLVLSYGNKGDDYHKWDLDRLKEIQKIVKYIETYSKEQVQYVDFRNPNDIYVKINTINIRLGKLDDNVYKRIERIPSILPQVKSLDSKIKYLDLSWEKVNYLKLK